MTTFFKKKSIDEKRNFKAKNKAKRTSSLGNNVFRQPTKRNGKKRKSHFYNPFANSQPNASTFNHVQRKGRSLDEKNWLARFMCKDVSLTIMFPVWWMFPAMVLQIDQPSSFPWFRRELLLLEVNRIPNLLCKITETIFERREHLEKNTAKILLNSVRRTPWLTLPWFSMNHPCTAHQQH